MTRPCCRRTPAGPLRRQSRAGFTLIEILVVLAIAGILTSLGTFAYGYIKERAARAVVLSSLQELYNAKESYYLASGATGITSAGELLQRGYINGNLRNKVVGSDNVVAKFGWHFDMTFRPAVPVLAYRGSRGAAAVEAIWYPAKPDDVTGYFKIDGAVGRTTGAAQGPTVQAPAPDPKILDPANAEAVVASGPGVAAPPPDPALNVAAPKAAEAPAPRPALPGPPTKTVRVGTWGGNWRVDELEKGQVPAVTPGDPHAGRWYAITVPGGQTADYTICCGPLAGMQVGGPQELVWVMNTGNPNYGYAGYIVVRRGASGQVTAQRSDLIP